MFNKNKKENIENDSQKKTIISLALWSIFFVIIILIVRGIGSQNTSSNVSDNYVNDKLNNYEYTYSNDKIVVFGKMYNGKQVFMVFNNKYYYDGKYVYEVKDNTLTLVPDFDLNILKITPDMINNLTLKLSPNKREGADEYYIPLSNFINLFDGDVPVDVSGAGGYNIIVSKYYNGDKLYMIKVDLSNYYKYKNIEDNGILTIDLYEQNRVNNFSSEYERMIGVIK